jgi:HEAT repeat protein
VYALSLLAEAPRYDIKPLLIRVARSPMREVRQKAYSIATNLRFDGLLESAAGDTGSSPLDSAVGYTLALSPARARIAAAMLHANQPQLVEAALEGLGSQPDLMAESIDLSLIERWAKSDDARWRAIAALAIGLRGDQGIELLHELLTDHDLEVVSSALHAAGMVKGRAYLYAMIEALANPRLRAQSIRALASFGPAISGTLADVLLDEAVPLRVRRSIPRVLKNIPTQRSVDVLLPAIGHPDLTIRSAVLKALNRLRETTPDLNFQDAQVMEQLMKEARQYYELSEALAACRGREAEDRSVLGLLARTLEARLKETLARLFRLLGLRYPPKDIYSVYLAVSKPTLYDASAALEFLDNVLDRDLKRVLIPLLEAPQFVLDRGRELFGVQQLTLEEAIRAQIQSGDPWLAVCAMAAAAQLRIRSLVPEIARLEQGGSSDVSRVAQSVQASLA